MYENFDTLELDEETNRQMHFMLTAAMNILLRNPRAEDFLAWARESVPVLAENMFAGIPPSDRPKAAFWFGVNLWNVAPLPDNKFKPLPLARPGRNDACPCGSGGKFKHCCQHLPVFDPFPAELFWPLLGDLFSERELVRLVREKEIPQEIVGAIAFDSYQEENYSRVIKLLEPLFNDNGARLTRDDSGLLDILCDAYDNHYRTNKKKKDLLERMSRHREPVIQAEAWQRISSMHHDAGDSAGAMEALNLAMRADPNNPSHSMLELVLLVADNKIDLARQRADFWLRKLARFEDSFPEIVDTLRVAKTDPVSALQQTMQPYDDERIPRLLVWMEDNIERTIPRYKVIPMNTEESPNGISPEFGTEPDGNDKEPYADPMKNAVCLEPAKKILSLEAAWSGCTPVSKPFSTQYGYMDEDDLWDNPVDDAWLEFLEDHPEAMDSLDILDDIVTAVYIHPANETPFSPFLDMLPLLERAREIVLAAEIPPRNSLPWIMPENRPALRLYAHLIHMSDRDEAMQRKLMEEYLALNPSDNHGFRSLLINRYLKNGLNREAVALADKYASDVFPETMYGRVLGYYRLNATADAQKALEDALEDQPLVAKYLVKESVAKPKFQSSYGVAYNSPEQAWLYRDAMREQWSITPGCLAWLKKNM